MEVGKIENGYLSTKVVERYSSSFRDENGKRRIVNISEEEQLQKLLDAGWQPVDDIEVEKLKAENGYIIRLVPFDAGERISFKYEKVVDIQKKHRDIEALKQELSDSDYQVTKCYEASLIGDVLPYDIGELHKNRQSIRDKINELENELLEILNISA